MAFTSDFGLGTLISNASNLWGTGAHLAREREDQRRDRSMWDREFERQQLTPDFLARVEAAKAAGIHPLIAFGGGGGVGGGTSPIVSDSTPMPQFQFSSSPKEDPDLRRLRSAQADMAELQVAEARLKLAQQPGNQGGGVMIGDQWQEQPAQITSVARGIPYLQAGPPAASEQKFAIMGPFGEVQYGNLPSSDIGEKIENMGELWQALLMAPMAMRFMWDTWAPTDIKRDFRRIKEGIRRGVGDPGRGGGFEGSSNSPW